MVVDHTWTKTPTIGMPSEALTRLQWPSSFILTSVGAQKTSKRWKTNDAFDIDPVLGSTATPTFAEFSLFYGFYRVHRYHYRIEMVNTQAFPLTAYVLNVNNDPGVLGANFEAYSTADFGQRKILSQSGTVGARQIFTGSHSISSIVGTIAPETEDNYRALVTGSPLDLTWLGLGLDTHSATNLMTAGGVYCQLSIVLETRLFGRKELQA